MAVSRYKFRTVNLKRFALLLLSIVVVGAGIFALHRMQVDKHAKMMKTAAQNVRTGGNLEESKTLYERYLNFQPRDLAVLAEFVGVLEELAKLQPTPARRREYFDTYERLISLDPGRIDDRRKLIDRYMNTRGASASSRAIGHIEAVMKAQPESVRDAKLMEQYAVCADRLGQTDKAVERYRLAIDAGNASSDAYLRLAALLQAGAAGPNALTESRKLLDRLVADKPNDPAARLGRARFYVTMKQREQAKAELQTALTANSEAAKSIDLVTMLVDLHREDGNDTAARDVLKQATGANPGEPALKMMLADAVARLGDAAGSLQLLREALRAVPADDLAAINVLDRLIDRGQKDEDVLRLVHAEIRRRFADRPDRAPFADFLNARLDYSTGNWKEALIKLTRAAPKLDRYPVLLSKAQESAGLCHLMASNPERALAAFQEAVATHALNESAKFRIAEVNARMGRTSEAAAAFRNFAEQHPEAREMLARLALTEQLSKVPEQRNWSAFETAIGTAPATPDIQILKATALRAQNKRDDALKLLEDAAAKSPDSVPLQLAMVALIGESDANAGLAKAEALQAKAGDKVELRLAKARLLAALGREADVKSLADELTPFSNDERFALLLGLGDVLEGKLKKPAEAVALYRKAADTRPQDLASRSTLVDTLLSLNKLPEADAVLEEIRRIDGHDGPTFLLSQTVRDALTLKGGETARINYLRERMAKVLKARPASARAMVLAAELDDAAGDADAALDRYRRAFTLGERGGKLVQRLVALLVARRQLDDARKVLAEAEQVGGLNDEMRRQGSLLEVVSDKPGTSAERMVKEMAESKSSADQLFRGQWFLLTNKPKDGAAAFEKALQIQADSPDAWLGLMLAQTASGAQDAAKATFEKARSALATADALTTFRTLGLAREVLGDFDGAEELYKQGLAATPGHLPLLAQLALLYSRLSRTEDAATVYRKILTMEAPDALKRQARRELAFGIVARPDGFKQVADAVKMLEPNAPPGPDDTRMMGLVIGVDPFRRVEARRKLEEAQVIAPPSQDDALRVLEFHLRDSDEVKAEEVLREALRGSAAVPPPLLAQLHRLQVRLKREGLSKLTLERLQTLAPQAWETAIEQARSVAAAGDTAAAAKLVLAHPAVQDPSTRLRLAVPALTDIKCDAAAEATLKSIVESSTIVGRRASWVVFLLGAGRGLEGLQAALELPEPEYGVEMKARLLANAVASQRRAALGAKAIEWDKLLDAASAWLTAKKANSNPMLIMLAGVLADARGDVDAAIASFESVLRTNPDSEMAANSLAFLLAVTGRDPARAEALSSKLVESVGPRPHLLDTRARARVALDRGAEALKDADAAVVQSPMKATYWWRVAQCREAARDLAARNLAFQKALQMGLKKEQLHPLEWAAFDLLRASLGRA